MTENELVGWYHQLNGHDFEQTLGDDDGQGSLVCRSMGSQRVGYNEQLNSKTKTTLIVYRRKQSL